MAFSRSNIIIKAKSAFTLLEVLISVAILSMITYAVYVITTQSVNLADETEKINEFRNSVRVVMKFMSQDVRMAFLPLSEASLYRKKISANSQQDSEENPSADQEGLLRGEGNLALKNIPAEPGTPSSIFSPFRATESDLQARESRFYTNRVTQLGSQIPRFQGDKSEFSFITSGFERITEGERSSVFSKIHYRFEKGTLYRIEDTDVFNPEDNEKSESRSEWPVIENLDTFEVAYFDWATEKWTSKWDSQNAITLDRYPAIVELRFTMFVEEDEQNRNNDEKPYEFLYRFPVEISQVVHSLQKSELLELRRVR